MSCCETQNLAVGYGAPLLRDIALYAERGKLHYRLNEWGAALNDFNRVLQLDASHAEARQYAQMVQEILEFRYKDIYNP